MNNQQVKSGPGVVILWLLALFGLVLIVYRFGAGLGAVTNLNDGYPWGLWIGVDVLAGIALAAGGFFLAGICHLFGGKKFHALARASITTAFLGYLLFIFALLIDLGRPWNLWRAIFNWNHDSPMFEVAWCVMLYTFVLLLEFLPIMFEKYTWAGFKKLWDALVPWVIIIIMGLFTFAMTDSVGWTVTIAVVLLVWEVAMRTGLMPRDKQMPILLIMAGVMYSTMHQSSLGTLFTLAPHCLHPLWYSPWLPLFFFLSAVMVAPAMVIFEGILSEKAFRLPSHFNLLSSIGRFMPYVLGIYLVVKVVELISRGTALAAFEPTTQAFSWWLEIAVGVLLPMALFLSPSVLQSRAGLFWGSLLVVAGLIWNRLNVAVVGIDKPGWETYYPHWMEIFITLGVFAIGLLVFRWAMLNLPIAQEHREVA